MIMKMMMMMIKTEFIIITPGLGNLHSVADLTLKYHHELFFSPIVLI